MLVRKNAKLSMEFSEKIALVTNQSNKAINKQKIIFWGKTKTFLPASASRAKIVMQTPIDEIEIKARPSGLKTINMQQNKKRRAIKKLSTFFG